MLPRFLVLVAAPLLAAALAAPPAIHPGIDIERLRRNAPWWVMKDTSGDDVSGSATAEQAIWPMFYLHWMPLEGHKSPIRAADAEKVVSSLWEGLAIDGPLQGEPFELPSGHPAVMFNTTIKHGELQTRYIVWACPESGRLFVADLNMNLRANAPPELMQWLTDMAKTVRCHKDAEVGSFPELTDHYEIPDMDIGYQHPRTWRPLDLYRVQTTFGGSDMAASRWPGSTREKGQDLALAMDAMRTVTIRWEPAPDEPMGDALLRTRTESYWREHANNILILDTNSMAGVWYANGVVQLPMHPGDIPPTHRHLFRTWMWRQGDTLFFAVGDIAGIHFGRRKVGLPNPMWDRSLEEMYEGLIH